MREVAPSALITAGWCRTTHGWAMSPLHRSFWQRPPVRCKGLSDGDSARGSAFCGEGRARVGAGVLWEGALGKARGRGDPVEAVAARVRLRSTAAASGRRRLGTSMRPYSAHCGL